ncbi:MAG: hypothetical protein GTO18_09880 [Anaerolineales bacterium]|nr:hypothetical protein [Anaerolineales bacterium]
MLPKTRFMTALRGEMADKVPVSLAVGPTNAEKWIGDSDWRSIVEAHHLIGSIPTYGHEESVCFKTKWRSGWNETHKEEIVHGERDYVLKTRFIKTPLGDLRSQERIDYLEYHMGQTLEPLIKTRADYEIYEAYVGEWAEVAQPFKPQEVHLMQEEIDDSGVWVWWIVHTFYQFYWVMRRVQDYLLDFNDMPEAMERLLKRSQLINEKILNAFNESTCEVMITNVSGASTSIIGPDLFRRWILPELKWLVANAAEGKFIGFHTTGKMREILPIMMEAEPHFVLRFESPRFGGDISLREAKREFGDQVCLMGGYDPHFYTLGTKEDIRSEAMRCIDEAAEGGGYIFANSDAIPEDARVGDVRLSVEIAEEYGKYRGSEVNDEQL